jgi:hypothetical protein
MTSKLLLLLALSTPTYATPYGRDYDKEAPIEVAEPEPMVDMELLNGMVHEFQTDPGFAGAMIGVRLGDQFRVVDRRSEVASSSPKTPSGNGTTMGERLISQAIKSSGASVSLHISYIREGIDADGQPYKETVTIDAGAASGAAAAAQASMDAATSKAHK